MNALGEKEIKALQADGWRFADRGTRVANGWMVWAMNAREERRIFLLADPETSPRSSLPRRPNQPIKPNSPSSDLCPSVSIRG